MTTTPITMPAPIVANPALVTSTPVDPLANKNTFLLLLVEQLKNQDPANPADGTQFVTQLAQFSSLEATTAMRDDLDAIRASLAAQAAATAAAAQTTATP